MKRKNLVLRSLGRVLKENVALSLVLVVAVAGVVVASLAPPQILKSIVDANLLPKRTDGLLPLALAYLAAVAFIGVFDFLKEAILTMLGERLTKEIRVEMMRKAARIRSLFYSANETGAVVSRFTNDVETINALFTSGLVGLLVDCLKIVGIVASVWAFSASLGWIVLALLPPIYLITRSFQKRMLVAQVRNRVLTAKVNNHIAESLKNVRMIKVYGKEGYMERKYCDYLLDSYGTVEKINFYDSIFPPVIQILRAVVIGGIVLLSSKHFNVTGISLGMIAATIELVSNLFAPVESLGMELQSLQESVSGIRRVNDFWNEEEDDGVDATVTASDVIPKRGDVTLAFNGVTFAYGDGPQILKDIRLSFPPGAQVAFTGRTGVGKTTLFRLVMGLLKPTAGKITINGVDVRSIPNAEKRHIFGYVDQGFGLIRGTVAEQISLRDERIPREKIAQALEFTGMADYVASLPQGMDTPVSGDGLFSQGQKQLLAIARALVTDPPILLLDEITANLDSITEEKILSVLRAAGRERMVLTISHRLSSIGANDTVVILEEGRVRTTGTRAELSERDDWFRGHIGLEKLTWS